MSFFTRKDGNSHNSQQEEGEILSSHNENELDLHADHHDEIYDSASSEDKDRLAQEHKKREDFWKAQQQSKLHTPEQEINVYDLAIKAAAKTNKKTLILRKKNAKRIQELDEKRIIQQPSLYISNTHFRSCINDYPLLTIDNSGKTYLHANKSLQVSECRLDHFIQKNISEEGTANYLNEVVKFENFAYQHRKKRRQNFE